MRFIPTEYLLKFSSAVVVCVHFEVNYFVDENIFDFGYMDSYITVVIVVSSVAME